MLTYLQRQAYDMIHTRPVNGSQMRALRGWQGDHHCKVWCAAAKAGLKHQEAIFAIHGLQNGPVIGLLRHCTCDLRACFSDATLADMHNERMASRQRQVST